VRLEISKPFVTGHILLTAWSQLCLEIFLICKNVMSVYVKIVLPLFVLLITSNGRNESRRMTYIELAGCRALVILLLLFQHFYRYSFGGQNRVAGWRGRTPQTGHAVPDWKKWDGSSEESLELQEPADAGLCQSFFFFFYMKRGFQLSFSFPFCSCLLRYSICSVIEWPQGGSAYS